MRAIIAGLERSGNSGWERALEGPEPNDWLIRGSSGKYVGSHGPLGIEHHLQLLWCDPGFSQGHRRDKGAEEQTGDGTEVQGRRLGIAPIIERHKPEIRFCDIIRGSDVIG